MNYPRLIIAIATFYVLPVVQLVFLYQTVSYFFVNFKMVGL
jgi:hypothetical protein